MVVKTPIDTPAKLLLLNVLNDLQRKAPPKGFEMSVVLKESCVNFVYPTPYELHFSNAWRSTYLKNPLWLCETQGRTDIDLAAHFTVIKHAGIALYGDKIATVFGEIPKECYIDSIVNDVKNAQEDVLDNPVSVILNLCRVLAYLREGAVLSKKQSGEWGLHHLPKEYDAVISAALQSYNHGTTFEIQKQDAAAFCHYAVNETLEVNQKKAKMSFKQPIV